MAFRSDIEALILGALQVGQMHGYHIVRRIREAGGAPKLTEGQIYPYLHKLEREGFVTAEWQTDTGAAPRKLYELTPAGLSELSNHRKTWERFASGVTSLISPLSAESPSVPLLPGSLAPSEGGSHA